jgi:flagellar basal-body rod protein FlgC
MSLTAALNAGASAMVAQSMRLNVVASNLANAESVGGPGGEPYRARQVVFRALPGVDGLPAGVEVAGIVRSETPLRRAYRPGHPGADATGHVPLPNVDPVEEMVNMISASRSYQMNVEVMTTTAQLMRRTLELGRG